MLEQTAAFQKFRATRKGIIPSCSFDSIAIIIAGKLFRIYDIQELNNPKRLFRRHFEDIIYFVLGIAVQHNTTRTMPLHMEPVFVGNPSPNCLLKAGSNPEKLEDYNYYLGPTVRVVVTVVGPSSSNALKGNASL